MKHEFSTVTFGKWILAGEHAVLRGSPALVFPLYSRSMKFSFLSDKHSAKVLLKTDGSAGQEINFLFWGVLEKALGILNIEQAQIAGEFSISSDIPLGAGLGASAAFCVAMTRFFVDLGFLPKEQAYDFAIQLENIFHGESSGVDVAVVLKERALLFERSGFREEIIPSWKPKLFLSYSGQRGMTADCIVKVKEFILKHPELSTEVDLRMKQAVNSCKQALSLNSDQGFEILSSAMTQAGSCFSAWGLSSGIVGTHLDILKAGGAVAVKPTGSGGGGYMLSLWGESPNFEKFRSQGIELIPCFVS